VQQGEQAIACPSLQHTTTNNGLEGVVSTNLISKRPKEKP